MDASTSGLIVAVVGVLGTLASALLTQRGMLRAKLVELDRAAADRREERRVLHRRELLEARRAAYAALNQSLRTYHAELWRWSAVRESGGTPPPALEEARHHTRDVYAEAQMVASDEVLRVAGEVTWLLGATHRALVPDGYPDDQPPDDPGEAAREWLERASEGLYEVRQTMRHDLGVTDLPVTRPDGYGRV